MFNALGPLLNRVLTLVSEAKKETAEYMKKNLASMDEEDLEATKEQLAQISLPSTYVMEISG